MLEEEETVRGSNLKPQDPSIKNPLEEATDWGTDLDEYTHQIERESGLKFLLADPTSVDKIKTLDDISRPLTHPDSQSLESMVATLTEMFYQSNQEHYRKTFNKSLAEVVLAEHLEKIKELYRPGVLTLLTT